MNDDSPSPNQTAAPPEVVGRVSLLDIALVMAENLRLLILAPLIAGALALGVTFLMTPSFTATTTLLTPKKADSAVAALAGSLAGLAGAAGVISDKNPADQWIGLLKSRTIADALIQQFNLRERYDVKYLFEARVALDRKTDIQVGRDTLIEIAVTDTDPAVAAKMANSYVDELRKLTKSVAITEDSQRRLFFQQQMEEAKQNLDKMSQALRQGGIGQDVFKTDASAAVDVVARMKAQIAALEIRIEVLRGYLTERSAELQRANAELDSLRKQLAKIDRGDDLDGAAGGSEYVSRYRDFKYYETLFELMAKQYELARIDEARDGAVVQVVDPAQVPEWKSKPKRLVTTAVVTVVVLIVTFVFIFARQSVRNAQQDPIAAKKLEALFDRKKLRDLI